MNLYKPNLKIKNGELIHHEGLATQVYLRRFQRRCKLKNGTDVCVIPTTRLIALVEELQFLKSLTLAA
jgi:hypothetical protein